MRCAAAAAGQPAAVRLAGARPRAAAVPTAAAAAGAVRAQPRVRRRRPAALAGPQQRWFLQELAAAALTPQQPELRTFTESRVVPYSQQQVFDVVADVAKYHEFVPFVTRSEIVNRRNDTDFDAVMGVGFQIFTDEYTSRVTLRAPSAVDAEALDSRTFSVLRTSWRFLPGPRGGSCTVRLSVAYSCANPLTRAAVDAFAQEMAERQVQAFVARCERTCGAAPADRAAAAAPDLPLVPPQGAAPAAEDTAVAFPHDDALTQRARLELDRVWQAVRRQPGEGVPSCSAFTAACAELDHEGLEGFGALAESPVLAAAVHGAAAKSHPVRGAPLPRRKAVFARVVYTMVTSSAYDRALLIFELLDRDLDHRLCLKEVEDEVNAHVLAVARAVEGVLRQEGGHDAAVVQRIVDRAQEDIRGALSDILAADKDRSGDIDPQEWADCWQREQALLDLFSVPGMLRLVRWAEASQPAPDCPGAIPAVGPVSPHQEGRPDAAAALGSLFAAARALAAASGVSAERIEQLWCTSAVQSHATQPSAAPS